METTYHPDWQNALIDFILSINGKDFFRGKKFLS